MAHQNKIDNAVDSYRELNWIRQKQQKWKAQNSYGPHVKKWIFRQIKNKKIGADELEVLKTKTNIVKLTEINNWKQIVLKHKIFSRRQSKDFKKQIFAKQTFENNKKIMEKEINAKTISLKKYETKYQKYQQKAHVFSGHGKKLLVKIAKTKTRLKDLNEFIHNKSVYTKIFLSDEPPLTTSGWVRIIFSYSLLAFWSLIILWPIYELVRATLNDDAIKYLNTDSYQFGFSSFQRLFTETLFTRWLMNTIIIAGITSLATILSTLLMGYAFSRFRFKGKKTSLLSIMLLQMIPSLSALTVFYVLYTLLNQSFKISGHLVLILIYVGGGIAGNTFIMKGYIDSISKDIDEAATIDGLSKWRIFTNIIIPLTKPMIALVALWSFIGPFGDYILPGLLLSKDKEYTLARGLRELITNSEAIDQAAFAAGSLIIAAPVALLFISLRKFLIGGITAGGVKG